MMTDQDPAPVFILSSARSGSTLLRFIMDSHPDFACPPETRVAAMCAQLAFTWSTLENAGSGKQRLPWDPAALSARAIAAIRAAVGEAFGGYLRTRGKNRWCDKSLDSYQFAPIVAQIFPAARFIVLTRHCMDVAGSVVELSPWGLYSFGLAASSARYPGNSVAAVADNWLGCTELSLGFAASHPDRCHRVRYEDLVTAPEETAAAIFSFLGVRQVPGITEACFRTPHDRDGAGDQKIWLTSSVSSDSVGRGAAVPASALPPALRESVNRLLDTLGYRTIDDQWGAPGAPRDPRAGAAGPAGPESPPGTGSRLSPALDALRARIGGRRPADLREIVARWPCVAGRSLTLVVETADGRQGEFGWTFPAGGPAAADLTPGGQPPAAPGPAPPLAIAATAATWLALLGGSASIVGEIAGGRLRPAGHGGGPRISSQEMHAIAALLGLATTIPVARIPGPAAAEPSPGLFDFGRLRGPVNDR